LGIGQAGDILIRVKILFPLSQEPGGIRNIDIGFRESSQYQPFFHGQAILLAQLVGNSIGSSIIKHECICNRDINGIKGTGIDPRGEERTLTDDLQRIIRYDQRINEYDQQQCH
jgi:hypothetical protein